MRIEIGSSPKEWRAIYGGYSPLELDTEVANNPHHYIVDDLIPEGTVNIAAGDSALGKTPFAYQLGLCVAAGAPFLGRSTRQGTVIYLDLENGTHNISGIRRAICGALALSIDEDSFVILTSQVKWQNPEGALHQAVKDFGASLIIIDTLRAYNPKVTEKNQAAAEQMQMLRNIAVMEGCSVLVLHHVRKRPSDTRIEIPALEDSPTMEWMMEVSGARALINQSDVRIGFDRPRSVNSGVDALNAGIADDLELIMKGHEKVRGEFGPIYFSRLRDPITLEPVAYKVVDNVEMLGNSKMISTFGHLPARFTSREAGDAYGMSDRQTQRFLANCLNLRLIRRVGDRTSHSSYYVKALGLACGGDEKSPKITCK